MPPLKVRIESDFKALEAWEDRWDDKVVRLGGNICMMYDWSRTWWEHYGNGRTLRIFVFESGEQLVGVVPIYIETIGIWPARIRLARLVGANIPPQAFDPPLEAAYGREALMEITRELFGRDGVDLLAFGPISAKWSAADSFREAAHSNGFMNRASWHSRDVVTVFDLPETFEEYLKTFGKEELKARLKKIRQLSSLGSVHNEILRGTAGPAEFETFLLQHAEQWNATGQRGHFADWPRAIAYHRDLVRLKNPRRELCFFRLLLDDRLMANRYCYRAGNTIHALLPSRLVGQQWDRLGLGTTAYLKFIESGISIGISKVNSGLGRYEYKTRLGGKQIEVGTWQITSVDGIRNFRTRIFLLLFKLALKIVRGIWYRRLQPRLPKWLGVSQSEFWLRYDI
ncbi:MAG: hypothetical protein JWM88_1893 [Verrucomicrobia bacterium]|nr:hypothetical protein [Verrucomicrobiota bacterium]